MLSLIIRTDKPEAELYLYDGEQEIAKEKWQAHRELSKTIHKKIEQLLKSQNQNLQDIQGVVIFKGPGSFTGLRIGFSVANALAYSLEIPIIAAGGKDWQKIGIEKLQNGENHKIALPEYGTLPHTTSPKH
jgi:tRNA threonylcarbamoyladenosine biosynthesis protein TsaB